MKSAPDSRSQSGGFFSWFVKLLPRDFREEFGEEMEEVHRLQQDQGRPRRSWRTLGGMLRLAFVEHCNGLALDFKLALRRLTSRPFFTLAAIFSLAVGVAASVAVFAVLEAAFWRPLPGLERMDRLVNVKTTSTLSEIFEFISYPNFTDLRQENQSLRGLGAYTGVILSLRDQGEPEVVTGQLVSSNYFSVLGTKPFRGRLIGPEEVERSAPVVVLSHHLWTTRFASDESVLGRRVLLNGRPFTVSGIGPPGFRGIFVAFNSDLFLPASQQALAGLPERSDRGRAWVEMVGRLGEGVSRAQAQQEFQRLAEGLRERFPDLNKGLGLLITPLTGHDDDLHDATLYFLYLLLAVGLMVLTVACANLANVYLARLLERRPELALRLALGAGRRRLFRMQTGETLLLGGASAALGILAAYLAVGQVPAALSQLDSLLSVQVDLRWPTLAFGVGLTLAAALILGVLPTWRADRFNLAVTLRQGDQRTAAGSRIHRLSVVLQVALSLLLLITGGLFWRTLQQASAVETGWQSQGVLRADLAPAFANIEGQDAHRLLARIRQDVAESSAFRSAALTNRVPLSFGARIFPNPAPLVVEGHPPPAGRDDWPIEHSIVSQDYLSTLGVQVLSGRAFRESDGSDSQRVAVISQTLAERFWPGGDALGRSFRLNRPEMTEQRISIVGIVEDVRMRSLHGPLEGHLYLPLSQHPRSRIVLLAALAGNRPAASEQAGRPSPSDSARLAQDPPPAEWATALASLRQTVHRLEPNLPLRQVTPLSLEIDRALLPQRIAAAVAGLLGLLGLFLVAVGLYGAAAQSVTARRRELAIRSSLGARPRDLFSLILRQSLWAVLIGLVLGTAAALALSHALRGLWTGLSPTDPLTFLTVPAFLLLAALVATLLPTLRAARTSPNLNN